MLHAYFLTLRNRSFALFSKTIFLAAPRLDLPENYNDGLIFRYDEVIRLKIALIAKPPPRVTW
jgi:hypothetical protein